MKKISWNDKFSTGNLIIDDHHKKIFFIYDKLLSLNESDTDLIIKSSKIIDELVDYTVYHFNAEKEIAQFLNLDFYQEHEAEHHKFTYSVINFQKRLTVNYSSSIKK